MLIDTTRITASTARTSDDPRRALALGKSPELLKARGTDSDRVTLQMIVDRLHVGLALADANTGEGLMMNRAGERILGKEFRKGLSLKSAFEYFQIVREDGSSYPSGKIVSEIQKARYPIIWTDAFVERTDGTKTPLRVSVSTVRSVSGSEGVVLCVFEDRSQEYRIERAQTEFVALASHQLRTPATGTKAYLSMLLDGDAGPLNQLQRDFLLRASRSNDRALRLVECLLRVAQVETGQFKLDLRERNVSALVRDSVEMHKASMNGPKSHSIKLMLPTKPATAWIDADKVQMLLDNLLDNARKFSPQDSTIEVCLADAGRHLLLSVCDHGVGIPEESQAGLFERFGRANEKTAPDVPGTGLGLYLVQRIVEMHGGEVRVASVPSSGTLVIVKIPKKGERNGN